MIRTFSTYSRVEGLTGHALADSDEFTHVRIPHCKQDGTPPLGFATVSMPCTDRDEVKTISETNNIIFLQLEPCCGAFVYDKYGASFITLITSGGCSWRLTGFVGSRQRLSSRFIGLLHSL